MSQLLYRFINSEHFSDDPFYTVTYLARYADHIGIHHFLCTKLRDFSYEEIEFFLPQLCHLLVSNENMQSVALEDFIFELCEQSAHGALLTFWLFQTHLHDLAGNPHSTAFKVCRRIYNRIQNIVFGGGESKKKERLKENVLPVTVLASLIAGSIAAPLLPRFAGPLAVAQARKPPAPQETISEMPTKLARSKTTGSTGRRKKERPAPLKQTASSPATPPLTTPAIISPLPSAVSLASPRRTKTEIRPSPLARRASHNELLSASEIPPASPSLPDLRVHRHSLQPTSSLSGPSFSPESKRRHVKKPSSPSLLSRSQKIHMLRANYFRREDQFLSALDRISNKLVAVPKPARLSALRAELALLNNDLPSEVDIPVICPATVHQNKSRTSHHRIVRINPAEATVLNSAERVPYLLMVEVLLDDFDFDPDKPQNQTLLGTLMQEEASGNRQRMFDLSESPRQSRRVEAADEGPTSVFEPSAGDIGTSPIIGLGEGFDDAVPARTNHSEPNPWPRSSSGANSLSTMSSRGGTPRSSDPSRTSSPGPRQSGRPNNEAPDLSALATHMRTAANMLAQLEVSGNKRPKSEVAAIKAKIIASMQSLEEQSFFFEEATPAIPTFDSIMASAATAPLPAYSERVAAEQDGVTSSKKNINTEAGAARMENDQMTSGVERKADRDDPSAATFGEEWTAKRERVRKSSPYGMCPNWELLSVIVKTGADLRQEAFACQLIHVCSGIWERAQVPVWLKRMRILVTGESSGLIETITNGTSLHSLKRSLTIASINSGHNPRGRIASLKDHFVKTFGAEDTPTYTAAVDAFVRSLAAYSVICHILQLKDRHNGNVLIDNQGHIIHIDFGFMLSNSPGSVGFESAPFKLTQEYVDVMGGVDSDAFKLFRTLCKQAFQALRKSADNLVLLVELMGKESRMPCFSSGVQYATAQLKQRFVLQMSEKEAEDFVDGLVQKSLGSYSTRMYDQFQYLSQGIY
ncbi:phosphatidylinositol 4-kinase-like protein PIK1 [Sphaerosporella brunnea]|uniref:1-phosphatidylinositol 4-kinase n=1 Tax=Sphaerosporella brunnea TaxID=1250544 RepID=A0A5J5EBT0_9PEZI|nr:phosphatidylinositol 4-kinase-like protein PIK1 [Sphaerosporella brunnea]